MFQFQFLWLIDVLLVARTNGLRFHHSSTLDSTSAAQVNLQLLINGKHAEKQNHAIFLDPFQCYFFTQSLQQSHKTQKMHKNLCMFCLLFSFCGSQIQHQLILTHSRAFKESNNQISVNEYKSSRLNYRKAPLVLAYIKQIFSTLLNLSKEVKFDIKLKWQSRNARASFFLLPQHKLLNHE